MFSFKKGAGAQLAVTLAGPPNRAAAAQHTLTEHAAMRREEDMLDMAALLKGNSRLGTLSRLSGLGSGSFQASQPTSSVINLNDRYPAVPRVPDSLDEEA